MAEVAMIESLACCSKETAESAFQTHGSVLSAVDAILAAPIPAKGNKFLPKAAPKAPHMDEEQAERCRLGRELMDRISVISAYHPQVLPAQSVESAAMSALQSHPAQTEPAALEVISEQ